MAKVANVVCGLSIAVVAIVVIVEFNMLVIMSESSDVISIETCTINCSSYGASYDFCVYPLLAKDIHKVSVSGYQYSYNGPSATVGLFDPEAPGESSFNESVFVGGVNVSSQSIRQFEPIGLMMGSAISFQFSAIHSLHVMLLRYEDIMPRYSNILSWEEPSFSYKDLDTLISKAIYHKVTRNEHFVWVVPSTTQYFIMFANDSPFPVYVEGTSILLDRTLPSPSKALAYEVLRPMYGVLGTSFNISDDYDNEYVSFVFVSSCEYRMPHFRSVELAESKKDHDIFVAICLGTLGGGAALIGVFIIVGCIIKVLD